jgi:hypothetical protein
VNRPIRTSLLGAIVAAALGSVGCAPPTAAFVPLGSHTLRVAPDKDADVVWLIKAERDGQDYKETVMRCHSSDQGPVCQAAKVPQ